MKYADILNESTKVGQTWKFTVDPTSTEGRKTNAEYRDKVKISKIQGEDIWFTSLSKKSTGHMIMNNFKKNYKLIK